MENTTKSAVEKKSGTPSPGTTSKGSVIEPKTVKPKDVEPPKEKKPVQTNNPTYNLPQLDLRTVVKLFDSIQEYKHLVITNPETLIQGMLYMATQPIRGVSPNNAAVAVTPLNNFITSLIMMTVERGSKGIARRGTA